MSNEPENPPPQIPSEKDILRHRVMELELWQGEAQEELVTIGRAYAETRLELYRTVRRLSTPDQHPRMAWEFSDEHSIWYIATQSVEIWIQPRPSYCDRGNYLATISVRPAHDIEISLDAADGWPRYYFDLTRAQLEIEAWIMKRGAL